ncbi:MAG: hypothetical protein J6D03_04155 [Clostridia bacterium]|nr:hypothetical protein [Clostridia bacterium]
MKQYLKEIIILLLQVFIFYLLPISMGNIGAIGMVLLILILTFVLSIIIASISKSKIKYLYSIIVAIMFIPSMFIHYNESALIHSIWYLVVSSIGLLFGTIIYKLTHKK